MQAKARAATVASSAARISWRRRTIKGGELRASGRGEWTLAIDCSIAKINDGDTVFGHQHGDAGLHPPCLSWQLVRTLPTLFIFSPTTVIRSSDSGRTAV